jgi:hypothetical protein
MAYFSKVSRFYHETIECYPLRDKLAIKYERRSKVTIFEISKHSISAGCLIRSLLIVIFATLFISAFFWGCGQQDIKKPVGYPQQYCRPYCCAADRFWFGGSKMKKVRDLNQECDYFSAHTIGDIAWIELKGNILLRSTDLQCGDELIEYLSGVSDDESN